MAGYVASLTDYQRKALVADWREPDGSMIWDLAKVGLANCVGLTPAGLACRAHLLKDTPA